jgi:hypothetical protein
MAKNLALLALLLGIGSLFLPMDQGQILGTTITRGAFAGTMPDPAVAIFVAPQLFAALFGATVGRKGFRRGLGTLHLLFGLAGLGLDVLFTEDKTGGGVAELGTGFYLAAASGVLVLIAGVIGLVKPEPKI